MGVQQILLFTAFLAIHRVFSLVLQHNDLESSGDGSVEHEVNDRDAHYYAKELFRIEGPNALGCPPCTSQEMDYCVGPNLLKDHCCCDRSTPERFPFIPHKCYHHQIPLCQPVVGDCEEFDRVDVCCCQPYLRPQWEYHAWRSSGFQKKPMTILLLFFIQIMALAR